MEINYCVRNHVGNAHQKNYYFGSLENAIEFAQKKSKRDKRCVEIWFCKKSDGLNICSKIIYLIRYYNGGTSRERVSA